MIAWLYCTSVLREKSESLLILFYFIILRLLYFKQSKTFCVHLKFIVFCLHAADFFLGECLPDAIQKPALRELVI